VFFVGLKSDIVEKNREGNSGAMMFRQWIEELRMDARLVLLLIVFGCCLVIIALCFPKAYGETLNALESNDNDLLAYRESGVLE